MQTHIAENYPYVKSVEKVLHIKAYAYSKSVVYSCHIQKLKTVNQLIIYQFDKKCFVYILIHSSAGIKTQNKFHNF